ncbi:GIY-YIG nuclease family protein [Streptomyces sp. NPDC057298]|uniref:GIY-YIG nuclease family protein n=1 Tax=Streptomyces sp. NPDC057298 TaxID=3346091 RepID=UPI0036369A07
MTTTSGVADQVYVIGSPGRHTVKIGYSKNPEKRLWFLQVGSPVELFVLATFEGGRDLEEALHHYFRACHIRGEWFNLGNDPVEAVHAAVALGITALRTTRSVPCCTTLDMRSSRSMGGADLDVRFPRLPRWRTNAVLAPHGISATPNDWVVHQCEGCPDCLAHFPPRLSLRPHRA